MYLSHKVYEAITAKSSDIAKSYDEEEFNQEFIKVAKEVHVSRGKAEYSFVQPHKKTVGHYWKIFEETYQLRRRSTTQYKKDTRVKAETSLRNTISNAATVLVSSHVPSVQETAERSTRLDQCRANEIMVEPGTWIKPELLVNTDDIGIELGANAKTGTSEYALVEPDHRMSSSSSHRSHWNSNSSTQKWTQKLTATLTVSADATGGSAPVFITFKGWNERELPVNVCPEGIAVASVPGLAIGGHTDNRNTAEGYIIFVRKGVSDDDRFRWYREHVFLPWVMRNRQKAFPNWREGDPILPEMKCVSWLDGASSQLNVMTYKERIEREAELYGVDTCKTPAACSGILQALDLSTSFRETAVVKRGKKITPSDNQMEWAKSNLQGAFAQMVWPDAKKKLIVDFVAVVPDLVQQVFRSDWVRSGFLRNGSYDLDLKAPNVQKMLGTNTAGISLEEQRLIDANWPHFLDAVHKYGHIPERLFDQVGIRKDRDENNEEVDYGDGVPLTNERCQRAKILSHEHQRLAREQIRDTRVIRQVQKKKDRATLFMQMVELATSAATKLKPSSLGAPLTLEGFKQLVASKKLSCPEMKAYIFVRKYHNKDKTKAIAGKKEELIEQTFKYFVDKKRITLKALTVAQLEAAEHTWIQEAKDDSFSPPSKLFIWGAATAQRQAADSRSAGEILMQEGWKEAFDETFAGSRNRVLDPQIANDLQRALGCRLPAVAKRAGPDKENHWVFDFVSDNIPVLAAMITRAGHCKPRVGNFDASESLLKSSSDFVEYDSKDHYSHQGAYLYWDPERGFIRSGKTNALGPRKKEHEDGAASTNPVLNFYRLYPTTDMVQRRGGHSAIKGVYEELKLFLALTWNPEKSTAVADMFTWNADIVQKAGIEKLSAELALEKKAVLIQYLIELAYDLMLARGHCVSKNPGFEIFLNVYGNNDR